MIIVIKDNKYFNIVHQASIDTIESIVNNDCYSLLMVKEETETNNISCENCSYNRLNDVDFHFINKCTKIDICPTDMKIKGFSCSFYKDYRDEK